MATRRPAAAVVSLCVVAATLLPVRVASASPVVASSLPDACDRASPLSARDASRQLQLAQVVRDVLRSRPDAPLALVSRAGLALQSLGVGLTHTGLALRDAGTGGWTVRQLYFACDEARPRVYDQGIAGFVLGTDRPDDGDITIVWPSAADAVALARAARDAGRALAVLSPDYSANANPWGVRYQNCNQWVAELMALAWGPDVATDRPSAQLWLARAGYAPVPRAVPAWSWLAAPFVRWIHLDDVDPGDRERGRIRTSLPEDLEAFVHRRDTQAERVRICRRGTQVVVQRGWGAAAGQACRAGPGDASVVLAD